MAPSFQAHTFLHLRKKSGALINGGSGYPQKVILRWQLYFKMSKTLMCAGGGSPSLAGNTGILQACRYELVQCREVFIGFETRAMFVPSEYAKFGSLIFVRTFSEMRG